MVRRQCYIRKTSFTPFIFTALLAISAVFYHGEVAQAQTVPTGCAAGGSFVTAAGGFDPAQFDFIYSSINASGYIELDTVTTGLDPEKIYATFDQDVYATFISEGTALVSDFGWFVKAEAETKLGYSLTGPLDFLDLATAGVGSQYVFRSILDDDTGCCDGGDGILDNYYDDTGAFLGNSTTVSEALLESYGFSPNGDGVVDVRDMRKKIGAFAAGTEILFFHLAAGSTANSWYSQSVINPDTWSSGNETVTLDLSKCAPESAGCDAATWAGSTRTQGFLPEPTIDRLATSFSYALSGTLTTTYTDTVAFNHWVLAASTDDPFTWMLGVEEDTGGGDGDFNDLVVKVRRKMGGTAQLKTANALSPSDATAFINSVSLNVTDIMPCDQSLTEYYISINNGESWVRIRDEDWDIIRDTDESGVDVTNWQYGTPAQTYREVTVSFADLGIEGRELLWRTALLGANDSCLPQVVSVNMSYTAATNAEFSRSAPAVLGNVIYSASYETPSTTWTDFDARGHLRSEQLYDPQHVADGTGFTLQQNWGSNPTNSAGDVLIAAEPSARNIVTPELTITTVTSELLGTGDGATSGFSGTLAGFPVVHSTLKISDSVETFSDVGATLLAGDYVGSGVIDRGTGEFSVNFTYPPPNGVPVTASYTYYTLAGSALVDFSVATVDSTALNIDDSSYYDNTGLNMRYDFTGDAIFDVSDTTWLKNWLIGYADGAATKKEWNLPSIDRSSPAVVGAPGLPAWYYGTDADQTLKDSFDTFRCEQRTRRTVAYVSSRMGAVHAFDAGAYRPYYVDESLFAGCADTTAFIAATNPNGAIYPSPAGDITINRGYYEWTAGAPDYGDGSELFAFIPGDQIAKLKNNQGNTVDQSSVDASPAAAYVQFSDGSWHTVLVVGEGNGGNHVMALDITNPTSTPTLLWDYSDPDLHLSNSSPTIAQAGLIGGSSNSIAFVVSGTNTNPSQPPSLFMINVETGSLIQRVYLNTSATGGVGSTPSGSPAILDSDGNGYPDRLYIGTDEGVMYKVTLPDNPVASSGSVTVCTLFTAPSPIYASPAAVAANTIDSSGVTNYSVKVLFGTGDSPYHEDRGTNTYYFYAIEDTDPKNSCSSGTELWSYEIPAGEAIFASAFATAGAVYFGTSSADTEDPCSPASDAAEAAGNTQGEFFALDLETGDLIHTEVVGNVVATPIVDDEHLYIKNSSNEVSGFGGNTFQNEAKSGGVGEASIKIWREIGN